MFEKMLMSGWGDMDFNAHMRNTAFLDMAADVRLMFFAEHGFPVTEFSRRQIGPVLRKDEIEYFREVHLLEPIRVSLMAVALADDGSRFILRNEFWREDEQLAATVTSTGGWLDLAKRRLTVPPPSLWDALNSLHKAADFQVLPSSIDERRDGAADVQVDANS